MAAGRTAGRDRRHRDREPGSALSSKAVPTEEDLPIESPPVSVVIVSRNQLEALRRTLTALLPPGAAGKLEVVVVDAGSRDGSAEVDTEFPAVRLVKMPHDFGLTRARNIGLRTATGEVVLLLETGIELAPAQVDLLVGALEADSRAAAVTPKLLNSNDEPAPQAYSLPEAALLAEICLSGAPLARESSAERAQAVRDEVLLLRKSFIAGMNYFDERRFGDAYAELDLFRQIKNANRDILILADVALRLPAYQVTKAPSPSRQALQICDRITGAAAYLAKRHGAFAGISFQIKMFVGALAALLRPSRAAVARRILPGIFSGVKIDGSQV